MDDVDQPAKPFMNRRRWIIFHTAVILLIAYVASYAYISRLRAKQYESLRMFGFLYVPPEEISDDEHETWRMRDHLMAVFYAPLNKFDREILCGPSHIACIMTGIGQRKEKQ